MTANQFSAIEIACRIMRGELAESDLDDGQWALVRLASSLGHCRCSSRLVCCKVIADFRSAVGFFADLSDSELRRWEAQLPMLPPLPPMPDFPPQFDAAR